jgi:hypothetical protein
MSMGDTPEVHRGISPCDEVDIPASEAGNHGPEPNEHCCLHARHPADYPVRLLNDVLKDGEYGNAFFGSSLRQRPRLRLFPGDTEPPLERPDIRAIRAEFGIAADHLMDSLRSEAVGR